MIDAVLVPSLAAFTLAVIILEVHLIKRIRRINGKYRKAQASDQHTDPGEIPFGALSARYISPRRGAITRGTSGALAVPPQASNPFTAGGPGEDEIPVVEESMPILAYRAAYLSVGRSGVHWTSLNQASTFGVDADASCRHKASLYSYGLGPPSRHDAPCLSCDCGFYAVPSDKESWHQGTTVGLLVELSGKVIEHEVGYRAGHQRVMECILPRCMFCDAPTDTLIFDDNNAVSAMGCTEHTPRTGVVVTRTELQARCPVPFTDAEVTA